MGVFRYRWACIEGGGGHNIFVNKVWVWLSKIEKYFWVCSRIKVIGLPVRHLVGGCCLGVTVVPVGISRCVFAPCDGGG